MDTSQWRFCRFQSTTDCADRRGRPASSPPYFPLQPCYFSLTRYFRLRKGPVAARVQLPGDGFADPCLLAALLPFNTRQIFLRSACFGRLSDVWRRAPRVPALLDGCRRVELYSLQIRQTCFVEFTFEIALSLS